MRQSVIKRSTYSTTCTKSGQADTTTGQTSTKIGQMSWQTIIAGGQTSITSG